MVNHLIDNPFTALLILGFFLLFTSIMLLNTRSNYTKIVKMIDAGEREAVNNRVEDWGGMILNNIQQECMEKKLSLTLYIFIFPLLSLLIITFSIFKLNLITNLLLTAIHFLVLFIVFYIIKFTRKKKREIKKKPLQIKENNPPKKEESTNNNFTS